MTVVIADVVDAPLDFAAHVSAVDDASSGAIATFLGVVRDHDPAVTGTVTQLDYSAHPDASTVLQSIAEGLDADHLRIAVTHRIGSLHVGDVAIVACVSSPHRAQAFETCRDLVERVKHELPVWKRQHTADGNSSWVGIAP